MGTSKQINLTVLVAPNVSVESRAYSRVSKKTAVLDDSHTYGR